RIHCQVGKLLGQRAVQLCGIPDAVRRRARCRRTRPRERLPHRGTGNFLYVAMEALLGLESKIIQAIEDLGGEVRSKVGPGQFHGLEKNPRAAKIAELVLWIGWLRWRIRNGAGAIEEPILGQRANINFGLPGGYDAVLAQDEAGQPILENPSKPDWPDADFIVGNPPFIGGKDVRGELGGDYAEALWKANPNVPASADFVMQWWDRAADILTTPGTRLKRFGFVTTNSITQAFSRRLIERHLARSSPERGGGSAEGADGGGALHHPADGPPPRSGEDQGLHLVLACPDHPWTRATRDAAAVRIAMTVAEAGSGEGRLIEVEHEAGLDTDEPDIRFSEVCGVINANLTVGVDPSLAKPLLANEGIASPGLKLHGSGFIVTPAEAQALGLGKREGLDQHIRPYRNGRDLLQTSRGAMVIDLFGLSEQEVRQQFPEVYQHLLRTVQVARKEVVEVAIEKHGRATKDALEYLKTWWVFGKPRSELRLALAEIRRYIATVETSKHRVFQFVQDSVLPDNKLTLVASDNAFHLGVLCSRTHRSWYLANAGMIGMFNQKAVWVKAACWDPFPFPDASPEQRTRIGDLAEELDATRKQALAEVPRLTRPKSTTGASASPPASNCKATTSTAPPPRAPSSSTASTNRSMPPSPRPMAGRPTSPPPKSSPAWSPSTPSARRRRKPARSAGCAPIIKPRASATNRKPCPTAPLL
ncbi:MAG: hypothetical protein M3448_06270, partial [Pseudomonadota bacterium]|nr:hypothetical protein [Pseudomonadota bacterium]